jgi:predicted CXXCH cytochrome family protein
VVQISKNRILVVRRCQSCHGKIFEIYQNSVHGSALLKESNRDVPICIDCHRAHDIKNPLTLDFHETIPEICSNCHSNKNVMAKYGISTEVVKTYLSDFHGVTLGFYKKQREELYKPARPIAVCTDCHGTHDIVSTRASDPKVLKAKLVKRCRKCHSEATENFPDAWLSHYEPSLKKAPCVYIISLIYRIFIPVLIIGLGLQILLHVWRYAVNR